MPELKAEFKSALIEQLHGLIESEFKAGRAISSSNYQKLSEMHGQLSSMCNTLKSFLAAHAPDEDDGDEDGDEDEDDKKTKKKAAAPKSQPDDEDDDEDEDGSDGDGDGADDDDDGDEKAKGKKKKPAPKTNTKPAPPVKAGDPRRVAGNAIPGQGAPTAADIKSVDAESGDTRSRLAASLQKARSIVVDAQRGLAMLPKVRG